ncbi:MAG: diguanylate cyclase [Planctomycetota bacterium]|jgi:diguanylate cyclase (GGDEF)-like protein
MAEQHTSNKAPVILLIDDDKDVHMFLKLRLQAENIELHSAENGIDGIRRAGELMPDLILLDLNMPIMDGFEVLRELKDDPELFSIPVIFFSGSDSAEDKVLGFDLGAIDFINKPFDIAVLRARLRSALRTIGLVKMLEQRAQIDGLTGLWNRSYFDSRLESEIATVERADTPLALAICDIDHFKSLNDQHGHPAGDDVLQGFADLLSTTLRCDDIACRYGGEEFGLILRNTNARGAVEVLERVRKKLAESTWPRHPERSITASFGVCDFSTVQSYNAADWVETADKALYQAKQTGRNKVVLASGTINELSKAG